MKYKCGYGLAAWVLALGLLGCVVESAGAAIPDGVSTPVQLVSGVGTLTISDDVVWGLQRVSALTPDQHALPSGISLTGGASYASPGLVGDGSLPINTAGHPLLSITMPVSGLSYAPEASVLTEARFTGGFTIRALNNGYSGGGVISISNLRADLATQTVYADVVGHNDCSVTATASDCKRGVSPYAVEQTDVPFFHFEASQSASIVSPVGITTIKSEFTGLSLVSSVLRTDIPNGYMLTPTNLPSVDILTGALGLTIPGQFLFADIDSTTARPTPWGSFTIEANFLTPVPEPSSYAMASIGVAFIVAARRRKCRH